MEEFLNFGFKSMSFRPFLWISVYVDSNRIAILIEWLQLTIITKRLHAVQLQGDDRLNADWLCPITILLKS